MLSAVFILLMGGLLLENGRAHDAEKPDIIVGPSSGVVNIGDTVNITCIAAIKYPGSTFLLHKIGNPEAIRQQKAPDGYYVAIFSLTRIQHNDEGRYTCQYLPADGFPFNSSWSSTISITVKVPKPTLTFDPDSGKALEGGVIIVKCEVHIDAPITVYLFSGRKMIYNVTSESTPTVSFTIAHVTSKNEGMYRCLYDILSPKRTRSEHSDPKRLYVLGIKAPLSILHPSSADVIKGGNLSMTCTAATKHPCFFYENTHDPYTNFQLAQGKSNVTVFITNVGFCDEGNYSCQCLVEVNGLMVYSARSNPMLLTVIDYSEVTFEASTTGTHCNLALAISLGCVVFTVLILICAALGVCLSKRKTAKIQPSSASETFDSMNPSDSPEQQQQQKLGQKPDWTDSCMEFPEGI
ncbi:carcinoembryonic antigen-related cell adhesion molecule 6-like isoform X2 [Heterodontus francisci]|uniref:carcinoembryonic antigen-related cell adhesion molecule 6-like isoform X2 n=1 Tax=Heterodontus francisci TaxID=7792 RepID=UPI00355ADE22